MCKSNGVFELQTRVDSLFCVKNKCLGGMRQNWQFILRKKKGLGEILEIHPDLSGS